MSIYTPKKLKQIPLRRKSLAKSRRDHHCRKTDLLPILTSRKTSARDIRNGETPFMEEVTLGLFVLHGAYKPCYEYFPGKPIYLEPPH